MQKYRISAIFLAVMMLLAGCGRASGENTDSEGTTTESSYDTGVNKTAVGGSIREEVIDAITMESADAWGVCGADLMYLESGDILLIRGTGASDDYYNNNNRSFAPWQSDDNEHTWVILEDGCTWLDWNCALGSNYLTDSKKSVSYYPQLLVLPESLDIGIGEDHLYNSTNHLICCTLANGEVIYADPAYEGVDFNENLLYVSARPEGRYWLETDGNGSYEVCYDSDAEGKDPGESIIEMVYLRYSSNDGLIELCRDIPVVEYAGIQYTGEEFGELWSRKLKEYRGYGYMGNYEVLAG